MSRFPASYVSVLFSLFLSIFWCGCSDNDTSGPAGPANPPSHAQSTDETTDDQELPSTTEGEANDASSGHVRTTDNDQPKYTNRLADETSPYLLLHAHNPVQWYPWGEEALQKARDENKLIFLSIGYSSCYWCHVMERESFMDEQIAEFLNEHFVCIKVDREERPDVDSIYMTAVQLLTGSGGWPLSMFLTPDGKPFFGGTYFPARDNDRPGTTGFLTIVGRMHDLWTEREEELVNHADRLTAAMKQHLERKLTTPTQVDLGRPLFDRTVQELAAHADTEFGGFGYSAGQPDRPKFPEPPKLLFLLEMARQHQDVRARELLELTLDRMAEGGIRDHWGGGFHRYSTDRYWLVPHFEKMLYDNGQLATVYAEAYELTGKAVYRQVVEELAAFVKTEMTAPQGGFYAALDAETEGHEGRFYVWTRDELDAVVHGEDWNLLAPVYGLADSPNFEGTYYVPRLVRRLADITSEQLQQQNRELSPIRDRLLQARNQRERPLTDIKVITSWNGLMIRGLADAGRILDDEQYLVAAKSATEFVLTHLITPDGRLLRSHASGRAELDAYLDDYAFLVDGLIALHRATGEAAWLERARQLTDTQLELFWDDEHGGFFFTTDQHKSLIARAKDPVDGVRPSGISVAASNLVYLAQSLDQAEYLDLARETIQSSADLLDESPALLTRLVTAAMALAAERPSESSAAQP